MDDRTRQHIVIVGGGYAGTIAAARLAARTHGRARVTLVNPAGVLIQRLRLHQVAVGQRIAEPGLAALTGRRVTVVPARAEAVDVDRGLLHIADADGARELDFDRLILATGSTVRRDDVPGAAEHAYTVADRAAAVRLHEAWRALPAGAVVAVGGGGMTGIEVATELAAARADLHVRLVTAGVLGDWLSEPGRVYLSGALRRLRVEVVERSPVTAVHDDRLALSGGAEVPFDLAVWCGGFAATPLAREAGLAVDERGSVLVDAALRSRSHPHVLAGGDAAAPPPFANGAAFRMTCQAGMPSGAHAADTIAAELRGREPGSFDLGYLHQPISLGRRDGLIQFVHRDDTPASRLLTGRTAAVYKEIVSRSPMPSIRHMPGLLRWPGAQAGQEVSAAPGTSGRLS